MNKVWKQTLISILGLTIITIAVFYIFEDNVREGALADMPMTLAKNAADTIYQGTNLITNAVVAMAAATMRQKNAIIATIQRRVNAAREEASRLRIAAVKEAKDSARFAANKASDTAARLKATIQRNYMFGARTAMNRTQYFFYILNTIKNWMQLLTIIAVVCILGGYLYKVMEWFVRSIICGFTFLTQFNACFLWYLLDIIGWIIYTFIECIIWIFDSLFEFANLGDNLIRDNVFRPILDAMKEFDCYFYDLTGFHLFHYSENITKKCYKCKMPPFPPFPNLFAKDGIKKAFNEYGLGSFIPSLKTL